MKQLLLFMSMVFLFLCSSCQEKELIAQGKLTSISENSATVDGLDYQTENGTNDFILGNKITVDGEQAFIYALGSNFYVSKANQADISTLDKTINIKILVVWMVFVLLVLVQLLRITIVKQKRGFPINENKKNIIALIAIIFIPTFLLVLGKVFPNDLGMLNITNPQIKYYDFGKLTKIYRNIKFVNNKVWRLTSTNYFNTGTTLKNNRNYAVIEINNTKHLFSASSSKQIQTEIEYINNKKKTIYEVIIYLICAFSIGLPLRVFYRKKPKKVKRSYVTEDDKCGYSVEA